ncbi:MAG: hypothetical protein JXR29_04075 [Methylothermaceae bacterium]|nr:hypothetical protein [Methylothermaceae bacterium]
MKGKSWYRSLLGLGAVVTGAPGQATPLDLSQAPLFTTASAKANVLVILDNSNSMDEATNGSAVGSDSPQSKSEIARKVVRRKDTSRSVNPDDPSDPEGLIDRYLGKINLGLMAYQQSSISARHLHNSPYDASFDSANYDPAYTGPRDSATKKFRTPNVSNPGHYVYYNIALPFYANSDQGSAYCYSGTADFDNGSESYPSGPWDTYDCYRDKTNENDDTTGLSNYFNSFTFIPTDSDLAQSILDFGTFLTWDHVGPTWFANSSPGRGYLHVPIDDLDATQADKLDDKLAPSQFSTNAPTDPSFPLQNAGLTPIEGTLLTAKDYFDGNLSQPDEGGPQSAPPNSCGKNFVALLTDGLPSTDKDGNAISDPAVAISDAASAASSLLSSDVETYVIGFALPFGTDPSTLDTIASAGGTSAAFLADNPTALHTAFDAIFTDILDKVGSAASAATNSTSLISGSIVYQARFNSADWSGQLLSLDIDLLGNISNTPDWDAGDVINTQSASSRQIITISRDSSDGMPFQWSDISALTDTTQANFLNQDAFGNPDSLGNDRVDFLRGDDVTGFRSRSSKLGDIVHSTPFFVGVPNAGFVNSSYASFASTHASRDSIIYVGANDGMLHGFDAATGVEKIAYVPGPVYEHLSKLTHPNYGNSSLFPSVPHRYSVDGSPMVADAKISGNWKTVLAGGLNGGGQGYYALDVTDPDNFTEANAASLVLWEFTDEDDPDLGFTYNQPPLNFLTRQSAQIAKMNNDKWALIVGNGYNNSVSDGHASTTGHAVLFILFLEGGTDGDWTDTGDYIKIDTGDGSTATPNGLATPMPVDVDGDGDVDIAYAGDLEGNLWKFSLTDEDEATVDDPANWTVDLLFTAEDGSNNPQPITTAPMVVPHPQGGYMVGFGTGKYLEHADLSTTDTHTLYGIWDSEPMAGVDTVGGRNKLVEQTVLGAVTVSGESYRVTSDNPVTYERASNGSVSNSSDRGWYMDLPTTGERVAFNPIARDRRFVYVTLIPDSSDPCAAGGGGWIMELDYLDGSRLSVPPFDITGDKKITDADKVDFDTDGDGSNETVPPSGKKPNIGIPTTPTVVDKDRESEVKVISGSSGAVDTLMEGKSVKTGRLSWRQIIGD